MKYMNHPVPLASKFLLALAVVIALAVAMAGCDADAETLIERSIEKRDAYCAAVEENERVRSLRHLALLLVSLKVDIPPDGICGAAFDHAMERARLRLAAGG